MGTHLLEIYDSDGSLRWSGPKDKVDPSVMALAPENTALRALVANENSTSCTIGQVWKTAEHLGMVSRRGMPKGFYAVEPPGACFQASISEFNRAFLDELDVNQIDFPLVFDVTTEPMQDLVETYESQSRMFRLAGHRDQRLSYAADPNLFAWLQNRLIDTSKLPYAIYSPQPVLRNFRDGELSMQRTRQFTVPDVHVLTGAPAASRNYVDILKHATTAISHWFGNDYIHVLDSVIGSGNDEPAFYEEVARATRTVTVVNKLPKAPRYYSQKTALLVNGGYGNVLAYNLQFDETNASRFGVMGSDATDIVVIHACAAMAISRMLPVMIGRGLSGIVHKALPLALAPIQVIAIPIAESNLHSATVHCQRLREAGYRVDLDESYGRSLSSRIKSSRELWQPSYMIVGDREFATSPVVQSFEYPDMPLDEFIEYTKPTATAYSPRSSYFHHRPPFIKG